MSKDPLSKIRANEVYQSIVGVLKEFGIERHEVTDSRPHPFITFDVNGRSYDFHFAGTPSSCFTPINSAQKCRRFLRNLTMTQVPAGPGAPTMLKSDVEILPEIAERVAGALDTVTVGDQSIPLIEIEGTRYVTMATVDMIHERPDGTARRNFGHNRERFAEGEDFIKISAGDFRTRFAPSLSQRVTENITLLTEEGYLLLVKSLNDDLAWKVQKRLVKSYFRRREAQPANNVHFMVPKTLGEALRLAADLSDKVEQQKIQIEAARPKVEFHDAVAEAVNGQTVEEVAKVLGTGQNRLFDWLRRTGMVREKPSTLPYQRHIDEGHFRVVERQYKDNRGESHTYTRTLVTGKGLAYIQKRFTDEGEAA